MVGYIVVDDSIGLLSSFKFSWWAPKYARVINMRNGPSRSSKVVDFGTISKARMQFAIGHQYSK